LALGISAQHILPTNFLFSGSSGDAEVSLTQTYYGYASYYLPISKNLTLRPCVLIKADSTHAQADADLMLMYKDVFYIGAGYRGFSSTTQDAAIILVGVKLSDNWFLGYSYDLTLSGLSSYESGTHEVFLKYTYSLVRAPKAGKFINNVRYN
jgi:type IX secretion system PorP/SprF family membrane protein